MAFIYVEPKEKTYAKAYRIYDGVMNGSLVLNIAQLYPYVDWGSLTKDDFICGYKSDSGSSAAYQPTGPLKATWYTQTTEMQFVVEYDATNGVLTVTPNNPLASNNCFPYSGIVATGGFYWDNLILEIIMIVDGVRSDYVK